MISKESSCHLSVALKGSAMKKLCLLVVCALLTQSLQSTHFDLDQEKIAALGDKLIQIKQPPRIQPVRIGSVPAKLFISKLINRVFTTPITSFLALETQEDVDFMISWMKNKHEKVEVAWYYLDNRNQKYNLKDLQKIIRLRNSVF